MVSKNNYSEKMRKIRPQKQRFSIRKFTVGAASVLIGLTFMGVNNQEVQADTTVAPEGSVKVAETTGDTDENADKLTDTLENTHPTTTSELIETSVDLSQGTASDEKEEEPTNSVTEATSVDEAAESNQSSDHMNSAEAQVEDNNQNNVNDPTVDQDLTTPAADSTSNDSENNVAVQNEELKTQKTALVSTPNYDTAKDQVNNYNQVTNDKFQTILNGTEKLPGLTIIEDNKVVIDTNISGVSNSIAEAEKDNNKQLANITTVLEDYWQEMDQYNKDLAEYEKARNEYIDHLKELGLWKEGDEDPLKLSQLLVLGSEENAIAKVESLSSGVTEGSGSILDNKLNIFYKVSGDQKGDFLKVTYTNLQNSSYAGKKISKIIITYSDWTEKKLNNRTSGIYFNNNPLDGFFYVGATGVTIDLKLYDSEERLITLNDNTAYITVGSLNSTGASTDYVEKAEIINSGNYRGSGVQLPESSVNVYRGQGQYGGDIVYSEKNNEIISKYELSNKDKETAIAIWGEAAVEKYTGWDEIDRKKEIFGSGLFKVSGIGVKIRFSNQVGSAWSTFSTNIPKITFDAIEPEMPNYLLIWHKTEVNLKAQTSVHIHYIDVHEEAKKGTTEFVPEHGQELLDQKQSHHDLAIDDQYFNELWAWESANYVLATEAVHPEAIQGVTTENEKHVYVYLKHGDEEATRTKEVSQVIHYVYTDGSQAAPDYIAPILVFTQTGTRDTVTGEVTWNGEWTESQRFESVVSPEIKGYQMDRPVVDAYDIIVNNSNFDQNLDKEDTVVYVANPTEEVTRTKEVNQIIHYVYEDGSQAAPDYKAVTLVFTQTGIKDTVTGEVTWDGEWTERQRFENVVSPEIKGYHTDRPVVDAYDIVVDNNNFNQNLDKEDTVVYVANPTETVTRDKVVSQVIHYVYTDGSQAAPDYIAPVLIFTQSGIKDTVTGEVTWDGEWTESQRFESVVSPEIKGYQMDRPVVDAYDIIVNNSNFDQNLDKEDTVVYVANPTEEVTRDKTVSQVIHYVYTDGSQAAPDYIAPILVFTQSGIKDTVTGEVTWDGEWTESQRFESVVSPEIKGYQMDRPVVDAYDIIVNNSNFDQNLDKEDTVVYVANSTEEVTRDKTVSQVIHYVYTDGSQAAPDYIAPVLIFTQSGVRDTVTGEVTWDGEWTESQRFESVVSPEIKGYQMDRLVVGPYDVVVDNNNFDQNLDKEDTVVYVANPTEEVTRTKEVNQIIHYIYEDGSQAAPDYKAITLVFTQTGVKDTVTGEVTWSGEWTESQRFESVVSPEIKGYHTNRPVVDAYDIVVDNSNFDQNLDKEDTVVYVANPTEEVTRIKEVNQIIHYVYEDGSQAAPDYKAVTLVFTQTGTKDTVTGEVTWSGEWTESQRFESVVSPEIKGYHTDRPVVDAYDVVVNNSNFDQNLDKEDTVVYIANPTEEVTRTKEVNQIIHYVYGDGSQAAPDYKAVTLVFTQTGTKDTVTGEVTWNGEWTESQRFGIVSSPEIKGYHTDRPVVDAYDVVVDNNNFDQNLDKEDTVVYIANPTEEVTRTKEVNQIIHYVYEDGSQAAPDYKGVTLVFTQTGTRDTVTGEVTWDGEWTESQRFESVSSPEIKGYHTDRPVVDAYDVVVDNSNFDQNLDKEDTVVYIIDTEAPTEPEDPEEPTEPEDPEEPTEPEEPEEPTEPETPEDPTEPEDPGEPTEPEDPTDPADPEDPTEPEHPEEPTEPEDPENPTEPEHPEEPEAPVNSEELEDSKVPVQVESQISIESTNDIPPISNQLSIDSSVNKVETVENKESGKVEAATTEDVSLPQTGQKHSNSGLIGLGLATIASILGLAGTRKRKKD